MCVCVYVCVCLLIYHASGYIPGLHVQSQRQHTVSCRHLKICIVWILLKTFRSGDVALFTCHDDL